LVAGLADLYEATFDPHWLSEGARLAEILLRDFGDAEAGGFFNTIADQSDLIVRAKNAQDGSTPSGTSLAVWALLRLGRLCGRADFEAAAERTLRAYQLMLDRAPGAFHQMLLAVEVFVGSRCEIVIAGSREDGRTTALLAAVRGQFLPHAVVMWTSGEAGGADGDSARGAAIPLLEGKTTVGGRPAAYVCRDFACDAPVTEAEELERVLRGS
jgi:uncharacterized protein YyaL (SSP411 family)